MNAILGRKDIEIQQGLTSCLGMCLNNERFIHIEETCEFSTVCIYIVYAHAKYLVQTQWLWC